MITLSKETDYTLAAIGDGVKQPIELLALIDDNTPPVSTGTAKLRVVHVAPFTSNLTATEVDVRDESDAVFGGLMNVPYKPIVAIWKWLPVLTI